MHTRAMDITATAAAHAVTVKFYSKTRTQDVAHFAASSRAALCGKATPVAIPEARAARMTGCERCAQVAATAQGSARLEWANS